MDKRNYTLRSPKSQEIREIIIRETRKFIEILQEKDIIKRKRIVQDIETLFMAMKLYMVEHLSFQRLSDIMAVQYNVKMSDKAWRKQLGKCGKVFLTGFKKELQSLISKLVSKKDEILSESKVYALDATRVAMDGGGKTVINVHTKYSLTNQSDIDVRITDNHTAENIANFPIESGALYIADRAYGRTTQFKKLISEGANFIIRMTPSQVRLYSDEECTTRVNFGELLSQHSEKAFSMQCYFNDRRKVYRIRVVMTPIPREKLDNIDKRVKRSSKKKQHKLSSNTLLYNHWMILATSYTQKYSEKTIAHVYRLRWRIELLFKRFKSFLQFHKIRRSKSEYVFAVSSIWMAFSLLYSYISSVIQRCFVFQISPYNLFSLSIFS